MVHFLWGETNCGRGSSFSDTCAGQKRNQFVAAAMLSGVATTNLETINLKYMESGHSNLEMDCIRVTIERESQEV